MLISEPTYDPTLVGGVKVRNRPGRRFTATRIRKTRTFCADSLSLNTTAQSVCQRFFDGRVDFLESELLLGGGIECKRVSQLTLSVVQSVARQRAVGNLECGHRLRPAAKLTDQVHRDTRLLVLQEMQRFFN